MSNEAWMTRYVVHISNVYGYGEYIPESRSYYMGEGSERVFTAYVTPGTTLAERIPEGGTLYEPVSMNWIYT
jgi:hypothetical protein